MHKITKSFASDNNSGVHPEVMEAIIAANKGHVIAYGDDDYTAQAVEKFKERFGRDIEVYFVFLGTGANVLGLKAGTRSFNSIICTDSAHIQYDECGATEKFSGCKLLPIPTTDGKLTVDLIKPRLRGFGCEHHSQPKVISITQATERGTIYTVEEIRSIADLAHEHNMLLHVDGARIANAAAALGLSLKQITTEAGVDILSFGGTKNGLMFGEAIIFFDKNITENFKYTRKQGMQLFSKMRFIAVQFETYLSNDLWLRCAKQANRMARLLAEKMRAIPQIRITQEVEINCVFAIVPKEYIPQLQQKYFFYVWDEAKSEVRWMTSFDTTEEDIDNFVKIIKETVRN